MRHSLIPVLALLLPALFLASRLGWMKNRWARRLGAVALVAAVGWSWPWRGVDLVAIKRLDLFLAAAVAMLLLLRHYGVPWTLERRRRLAILTAIAVLAVANHCNYFAFHGHGPAGRVFVHLHDVAHYYLGAKYYGELGYRGLYTAMLRAEAERYDDRFKAIEARDLTTYERVHIRTLLEHSEPVKAAFSPQRWDDFGEDVAFFRDRLGPALYGAVLLDHGFNPTPVWALAGGVLANAVPAGSERGIAILAGLDVALLAAALAIIAWAFGVETMLLALIYYCVVFGAGFAWTGGGFLRQPWFCALIAACAALARERFRWAGALLALATMLRLFPILFVLPIAFQPRARRALLAAFAVTAASLFALTALLPRGLDHWREFGAKMTLHVSALAPNVVGVTEALAWRGGEREVTAEELAALAARRQRIHRAQLVTIFLPALVAVAFLARRRDPLGAVALGLPLLYLGTSLAGYYYVFLVVLILVHRRSPRALALIFAAEAAPYALQLFEDREALLFVYRGLLLFLLYLTLETGDLAARQDLAARRSAAPDQRK